jgi:ATP-dependent 26S proteasome regulatory subunit
MPPDPELVRALRAAVERDPDSLPLRLHLAGLLLELGAEAEALEQYAYVLQRDPANADALRGAQRAAEATGDAARADGYRRLADALAGRPGEQPGGDTGAAQGRAEREEPLPAGDDPLKPGWWDAEFPTLRLADVGGMEAVKRRLNVAFIGPLRNPEVLRAYGRALRGGLLLYGPPGCGKTFIARATAGEIGARFVPIGLNDVLSMWLGESERHLHELFEAARRNAPCVLFFDEIDAIGQRRSLRRQSAGRNVVNQLLAEMDGVDGSNDGVFVLGATNHPWDVDAALLRPGRFDRMALVLPPDRPAREAILDHHLKGKPVEGIDVGRLAVRTEDFSGADLAHLCDSAVEYALEESLAGAAIRSVTARDFDRALTEVRPSTRAWFETARNFVLFANGGGMYDDLQAYMRGRKLL